MRNLLPSVRKVLREGQLAEGVVLARRDWPGGTIGVSRHTLTVRVSLGEGRHVDIRRYMTSVQTRGADPQVGDTLPVRFLGDRAEIDFREFRRGHDHDTAQSEQRRAAEALRKAEQ